MQNIRPDPIEAADLSEYLKTGDFQFELEVFQLCLKGGDVAEHGGTYQDPVTKKDRQFDIRMRVVKNPFVLKLAIECKKLTRSFPLLVSRVPRRKEENFHNIIISRPTALASATQIVQVMGPGMLYQEKGFVGKATDQVGKKITGEMVVGDAKVYEKWSQAVSSAFDLVARSADEYERTDRRAAAIVVLPMLILPDKTLWTADYSGEGRLMADPKLADECTLFLGKSVFAGAVGHYKISHLHIFTKTKFDGFLDKISVNDKYWTSIFPGEFLGEQFP
jgi:hypothetical protein